MAAEARVLGSRRPERPRPRSRPGLDGAREEILVVQPYGIDVAAPRGRGLREYLAHRRRDARGVERAADATPPRPALSKRPDPHSLSGDVNDSVEAFVAQGFECTGIVAIRAQESCALRRRSGDTARNACHVVSAVEFSHRDRMRQEHCAAEHENPHQCILVIPFMDAKTKLLIAAIAFIVLLGMFLSALVAFSGRPTN